MGVPRLGDKSELHLPAYTTATATGDLNLEQKILQVLGDAGSPMTTSQLVRKCQAPKKKLNQVLYQMKKASKGGLTLLGPATWCLGDGGTGATGEVVPALAVPSLCLETEIYRLLEARGPHKALSIAQALGMKTAKEVNPDLYLMRNLHLLTLDEKSNAWGVYQPGRALACYSRNQSTPVIYQQNPINMICQKGPNSCISIANSENIQIGHGNVIVRHEASGESGSTAPVSLPPTVPADASARGPPAGSWGPQDICMEQSVLRRVQMGHGNQMTLHSFPAEGPAPGAYGGPQGTQRTARCPEASIDIQITEPGPRPEGAAAQRVRIRSCFLEDTTVGDSNRMTVSPGTAGPGGGSEPEAGGAQPEGPGEDAGEPEAVGPAPSLSLSFVPSCSSHALVPNTAQIPRCCGRGVDQQLQL
uniref:Z-DNA binding protein 1 n=1 Tax=Catagonus wagneri TaxID=51154 RepID=A0A8C3WKI5_9CETA